MWPPWPVVVGQRSGICFPPTEESNPLRLKRAENAFWWNGKLHEHEHCAAADDLGTFFCQSCSRARVGDLVAGPHRKKVGFLPYPSRNQYSQSYNIITVFNTLRYH